MPTSSFPDDVALSCEPPIPPNSPEARREVLTELLVAAGEGDRDAFSDVFRATYGSVKTVASAVLRDHAQGEEVAQEVLLEVWLKAPRFDPQRGSAYTWIMMITRRRAIDRARKGQLARVRDSRYHDEAPARDESDVADVVVQRLASVEVKSRLSDLTPLQREAVSLAFFGGHSYAGVARMLGIPAPTAKSRIRDGLIRLRASLAEQAA